MNIKTAIDFVLRQEDSTLSGVVTNAPEDRGGRTRFGISERWHPDLTKRGFYDKTLVDNELALEIAEAVYEHVYAEPLCLEAVESQAMGTALLSMAICEGSHEAVTVLQATLGILGYPVDADGCMGKQTTEALNAAIAKESPVLKLFGSLEHNYFGHIAEQNPTQAKWLHGWTNRVDAVMALA